MTTEVAKEPANATGGRLLTPDVARGLMLLLIAVANVSWWIPITHLSETVGVDRVLLILKGMFIDQRAYPLFSMLAGFGVAAMASRFADFTSASQFLKRRGWVLLGLGAIHGLVFPGDIIGTYGLTTIVVCLLMARSDEDDRANPMILTGVIVALLSILNVYVFDLSGAPMEETPPPPLGPPSLLEWIFGTLATVPFSAVLPCFIIGVYLWRSGVLAHPEHHRGRLLLTAVAGLTLAALASWPMLARDMGGPAPLDAFPLPMTLQLIGGYAGGLGWMALMALCCSLFTGDSRRAKLPWFMRILVATGRRSMSCYLLQTLVFCSVFNFLLHQDPQFVLTPSALVLIASLTWLGGALISWLLQARGLRGPAEILTRHLIHRGVKNDS